MSDTQRTITINDKQVNVSDLDGVQQYYLRHIDDLNARISSAQFGLDEMRAAREYFGNSLAASFIQGEIDEAVNDSDSDNS